MMPLSNDTKHMQNNVPGNMIKNLIYIWNLTTHNITLNLTEM